MDVEVIRSHRRRKTVQARVVAGVVQVTIPAAMSAADERRWVAEMVSRIERRHRAGEVDLAARAEVLATRYGLPSPASICWVENQAWRWGSCTPAGGTIRISNRLAAFPAWVRDYVIVHELAHLVEANHGPAFQALVDRYPKAERARGFLIAMDLAEVSDPPDAPAGRAEPGAPPDPCVPAREALAPSPSARPPVPGPPPPHDAGRRARPPWAVAPTLF